MSYFILTGHPTTIHGPFTWQEVQKRITPDKYGSTEYGEQLSFLDAIPEQDSGYFESVHGIRINHDDDINKILIVKGEIVVPKSVKVTTKFEEP